ncbi:hypothetical protein BST61_g813 [Cercospora zeina]
MAASTQKELPPDFFNKDSTMGVQNPLWSRNLAPTITIEHHEDILRFAARYTIEELVRLLAIARPFIMAGHERVSARLSDATEVVATAYDVPRAVMRRQFDAAQIHFGVQGREDLLGARGRKKVGGSSGSPGPSSGDSVMTVVPSDKTVQHWEEMLRLRDAELAASTLMGLSNRAWWEGMGVKECEERLGKQWKGG